jgi:hypothetical protein
MWTSWFVYLFYIIPEEFVVQLPSLSFLIESDFDFCMLMNFYIISKFWFTACLSKHETFGFFGVIRIGLNTSFLELLLFKPGDEFYESPFIGLPMLKLDALTIGFWFELSFCYCCC